MHRKALKALAAALACLALLAPSAAASPSVKTRLILTHAEAVKLVRMTGGSVKSCKRVTARRFRCRAVYWSIRHEAEEVEPGVWVEIATEPVSEEVIVEPTVRWG